LHGTRRCSGRGNPLQQKNSQRPQAECSTRLAQRSFSSTGPGKLRKNGPKDTTASDIHANRLDLSRSDADVNSRRTARRTGHGRGSGRWNTDTMAGAYLSYLPLSFMRSIADFPKEGRATSSPERRRCRKSLSPPMYGLRPTYGSNAWSPTTPQGGRAA
jgi:hypothetical protein